MALAYILRQPSASLNGQPASPFFEGPPLKKKKEEDWAASVDLFLPLQFWMLILATTMPMPAGYFMPVFVYGERFHFL